STMSRVPRLPVCCGLFTHIPDPPLWLCSLSHTPLETWCCARDGGVRVRSGCRSLQSALIILANPWLTSHSARPSASACFPQRGRFGTAQGPELWPEARLQCHVPACPP